MNSTEVTSFNIYTATDEEWKAMTDYKTVPVEPTEEMWLAFFSCNAKRGEEGMEEFHEWRGDYGNFLASYQAMIAAAPTNLTKISRELVGPAAGELERLAVEIAAAINRNSAENGSDTPDFIIANFLVNCLDALNAPVQPVRGEDYGKQKQRGRALGCNRLFASFVAGSGLMGATAPGQRVTAGNVAELPEGSVVRIGDGSRLIHLHDGLWLWCCDHAWCYDRVEHLAWRLDDKSVACHVSR